MNTTYTLLADFFSKKGLKLGLSNIQKMDALFDHPSKRFPTIHVGGTNGKGSVTTKIASALALKNKRVGLYTSPHLSTFRERIQINGSIIEEQEALSGLLSIVERLEEMEIKATFFECMTLLAFLTFAKEEVDVAVIEVGLGGRFDATNIIRPVLSVITSIQLDHTRFLGETLEEIAFEKAGIIKEEVAVLVGPKALPFSIFEKEAFEKKAPFHRCEGVFSCYEEENQKIAERALSLLPFESDLKGLEARPPCRFERFSKEIPIVLDVAHNPGGFEALFARLKGQKIHLLLALGSEKEVLPILEVCKRNALFIHLTQSKNPKAASPYDLGNLLERLEFQDFAIVSSVKEAFHEAREHAFKCGAILCVAGTFYIMSEIRKELGLEEPQDPVLFSPY